MPCIVVHPSPLVAEDLRELLILAGASEVTVVTRLEDLQRLDARLALVAGDYTVIAASQAAEYWRQHKTPIVVLNGTTRSSPQTPGVFSIRQPFKSDDIVCVLRELSIFD